MQSMDNQNGILIVNKPSSMTSRDVVNKVGKILKTKKIGHTGTLDPLATGVLVLCIGKATKIAELLTASEKEYLAEMTFGIETDTLDITGTVLKKEPVLLDEKKIEEVLSSMIGTYQQQVPLYSAVHMGGKKLYEYARNGQIVEPPFKEVTIFDLKLVNSKSSNVFTIQTKVSKGTYIRSLIRDIARKLDTIAVMSKLERIKQGHFELKDAITLEAMEQGEFSIISIEEALCHYPKVIASEPLEFQIRNGQIILNEYQKPIILFLSEKQELLALYHTYEKDSRYLKPWKMF